MKKTVLSSSDASLLNSVMSQPGWEVVQRIMNDLFDEKYSKLRKCVRDTAFYKLQGGLDTIDELKDRLNYKLTDEEE